MDQYAEIHKEIIEQSKRGNIKAQHQLYNLYTKSMFNICMRMLKNRSDAEDILQESFCDVFDKLATFQYESSFGAWLRRVVINKCINFLKAKKVELVLIDNLLRLDVSEESEDDFDIELNVAKVHKAIELLPDGYRVIFNLKVFEGYEHSEIAQILEISESTSKTQFMRAKRKLKEILKNKNSNNIEEAVI